MLTRILRTINARTATTSDRQSAVDMVIRQGIHPVPRVI